MGIGKDEVASSNLASSSMVYVDFTVFYYVETVISAILHKFYTTFYWAHMAWNMTMCAFVRLCTNKTWYTF